MLFFLSVSFFELSAGNSSSNLVRQHQLIQSIEVSNGTKSTTDSFWRDAKNVEYYGDMIDVSNDVASMSSFNNFTLYFNTEFPVNGGDFEATYAVEHFFWGKRNGIVLELGAVDGILMSQSLSMIRSLGWHRILVEGDPQHRDKLSKNYESLAYSCAICDTPQIVHFIPGDRVGGIVEFMNEDFLRNFHKELLSVPKNEWTSKTAVKEIHCIPLSWIFEYRQIHHVNFFILDVEGGELEVLKSIDFSKVLFDVISVETDFQNRKRRPVGYVNEVTAFMAEHGYRFVRGFRRNSWFVHSLFTPSSNPAVVKGKE